MVATETRERWERFKVERARQQRRDAHIKMILSDALGLAEIVGGMVVAWFLLMVLYA